MACAQEVLGASRLVKAFGREAHEQQRFLGHAMNWARQHNALASIGSGFDFVFGMTVTIGTAIALFIGVTHVKGPRVSERRSNPELDEPTSALDAGTEADLARSWSV